MQKTIIIIGATGGIGRVLTRSFSQAGHNLVLVARTREKLQALKESIGSEQTLIVPADASQVMEMQKVFSSAKARFGKVDAVIISAGTWKQLGIEATPEEAVALLESHFRSLFLPSFVVGEVAQHFFRENGNDGLIVNISSHAAIRPELSGNLTYGPMKAAAFRFMQGLRHELEGTGVRVVDLAPAIVNTEEARELLKTPRMQSEAVQPEDIAQWILDHLDDPNPREQQLFDSSLVL